ncbi:MAG: hypothetical protein CMF73_10215 [Maricaulis sp.]|nr:hypothetical protein [Maricaulis sp.]
MLDVFASAGVACGMDEFREFLNSPWTELVQWAFAILALVLSVMKFIREVLRDGRAAYAAKRDRVRLTYRGGEIDIEFTPILEGVTHHARVKTRSKELRLALAADLTTDTDIYGAYYYPALPEGSRRVEVKLERAHKIGQGQMPYMSATVYAVAGIGDIEVEIWCEGRRLVTKPGTVEASLVAGEGK